MRIKTLAATLTLLAATVVASAQETPRPAVRTYRSLADAILAVKKTEANFVKNMLAGHVEAARMHKRSDEWAKAAAEVALFANEGDNAIGGVRKRLLEGGHHHNAAGEAQGIYEPGYVIITKANKRDVLALSATLRSGDEAARTDAWRTFRDLAASLVDRD